MTKTMKKMINDEETRWLGRFSDELQSSIDKYMTIISRKGTLDLLLSTHVGLGLTTIKLYCTVCIWQKGGDMWQYCAARILVRSWHCLTWHEVLYRTQATLWQIVISHFWKSWSTIYFRYCPYGLFKSFQRNLLTDEWLVGARPVPGPPTLPVEDGAGWLLSRSICVWKFPLITPISCSPAYQASKSPRRWNHGKGLWG